MDHSGMNHGGMEHGHMNHGDMDMGDGDSMMCSMNMIFTWDYNNLCIVFSSWRITSAFTLALSLLAVIAMTAGYEAVREASRRLEAKQAAMIENMPNDPVSLPSESSSPLGLGNSKDAEEKKAKMVNAVMYGVQVFYSFFIMLLFMTYNGWVMIAVGVGATLGFLLFSGSSATKSAACH